MFLFFYCIFSTTKQSVKKYDRYRHWFRVSPARLSPIHHPQACTHALSNWSAGHPEHGHCEIQGSSSSRQFSSHGAPSGHYQSPSSSRSWWLYSPFPRYRTSYLGHWRNTTPCPCSSTSTHLQPRNTRELDREKDKSINLSIQKRSNENPRVYFKQFTSIHSVRV